MRRAYISGLVITTILSFVFLIPNLTLWAMFATFGLVFLIVIPLPYSFLALWLAFPAYKFRDRPAIFWSLLAVGGCAFAAILLGLPLAADARFKRELAAINQPVRGPLDLERPIGVEIRRVSGSDPDLFEVKDKNDSPFARSRVCQDLCERLLTAGDVAWVRIVLMSQQVRDGDKERAIGSALLIHADASECQRINPDFGAGERCVVFVPDHGEPAELKFEISAQLILGRTPLFKPYFPREVRTASAYLSEDTTDDALFKLGYIRHSPPTGRIIPNMPVGPGESGRGGWRFARENVASDPFDLSDTVEQLGLSLGPLRKTHQSRDGRLVRLGRPVDAQDAAYVASLLEPGVQDAERSFPSAFQDMLQAWYGQLQHKQRPLTKGDLAAFCQSVSDPRTLQNHRTRNVLAKHGSECPRAD